MGDSGHPAPALPETRSDYLGVDVGLGHDRIQGPPKPHSPTDADWWDPKTVFGVGFTVLGCGWTVVLYTCYRKWSWKPMIVILSFLFNILVIIAVIAFWIVVARILWDCILRRKK